MKIASVTGGPCGCVLNVTTQPVVVGIEGKSAFQVWQEHNPGGTYDDWLVALTPNLSFQIVGNDLILTIS